MHDYKSWINVQVIYPIVNGTMNGIVQFDPLFVTKFTFYEIRI